MPAELSAIEPTEDLEMEVSWPIGPSLSPEFVVLDDLNHGFMVEVEPCLATAYAWLDKCETVPPAMGKHPPLAQLLSPGQRRAIARVRACWPETARTLAQLVRKSLRPHMAWTNIVVHAQDYEGEVCITVGGTCDSLSEDSEYAEHGISAELLGSKVITFCDQRMTPLPAQARSSVVAPRLHPLYIALTPGRVRELLDARDWAGLTSALDASRSTFMVADVTKTWWWKLGPEVAIEVLDSVRPFMGHTQPKFLTVDELKSRPLAMTRAALDARICQMPSSFYGFDWKMWLQDLELLRIVLELGEDPHGAIDEYGRLEPWLEPKHIEILRKCHPALVAEAEAEAGRHAAHLPHDALTQWLRFGWIELEADAERPRVSASLSSLIEKGLPIDQLADAIMELPGVAELHVSDDQLEVFFSEW